MKTTFLTENTASAQLWIIGPEPELGTCDIFSFFQQWKIIFIAFSIKLIWLGVGCLNSTYAEIGYRE